MFTLALDGNGFIYAGGPFNTYNGVANSAHYLSKLNIATGAQVPISSSDVNTATGNGTNGAVYSIVIDATGNVYAGGLFTISYVGGSGVANNANRLLKLSPSGAIIKVNSADVASPTGNGYSLSIFAMTLDLSGNLYVGGVFSSGCVGAVCYVQNGLAKISASGAYIKINPNDGVTSTSNGVSGPVWSLYSDRVGNLYVGGGISASYIGGSGVAGNSIGILKINSAGTVVQLSPNDTPGTTGNGVVGTVYTITKDRLDNLYVGGAFSTVYFGGVKNLASHIVKLDPNGNLIKINSSDSLATATTNGFNNSYVYAILADKYNNMYICGDFVLSYIGGISTIVGKYIKITAAGLIK